MFTGIIEEIGEVRKFNQPTLEISCNRILNDVQIGDSIAIDGCCQTVVDLGKDFFRVNVSPETLSITNFPYLKVGQKVNLERALTPTSRMGGHIVQGHIDQTGVITKIQKFGDFYEIYVNIKDSKYIVKKGSIALNGISLTIADPNETAVKVTVIPHTFENTNLQYLKIGEIVNIETDIIGRYLEKFLSPKDNRNRISMEFLSENGFI